MKKKLLRPPLTALCTLIVLFLCVYCNSPFNREHSFPYSEDDYLSISIAGEKLGIHLENGKLSYNEDINPQNLQMSLELYDSTISIIQRVNLSLLGSAVSKGGIDSSAVNDYPPGDCVITSLVAWGDYTYGVIEQYAIDSCNYSAQNGIHVDEIPHLLNILYPDGYDSLSSLPNQYYSPQYMVAVILYYDPVAEKYRTHMVNVNNVYWGLAIDYDGGSATVENCYAFYQKR